MSHTSPDVNVNYTTLWQDSVPKVAWGTILLFVGYIVSYIIVIALTTYDVLPYPLASLFCAYLAYVGFTIVHDAGHGSIIAQDSKLKPMESIMGWISGVPLLLIPYSMFKHIHDRHHAYTNDPERDPDHFSFGKKWYQVLLNCLFIPFQYHIMAFTTLKHDPCIKQTHLTSLFYFLFIGSLITLLLAYGYSKEVIYFLLIPNIFAVLALAMLFDYLPHHPHKSLSRYHNSRVYPSKWLNLLLLGQNYHLTHHMYPKVPWYLYRSVYLKTLPDLASRNAPIENINNGLRANFLKSPHTKSLQPDGRPMNRLLTVSHIEKLTDKSVNIGFELPNDQKLKFNAGQYLTISKCFDGKQVTRCYSICSSPEEHNLTIGVKAIDDGVMSHFLNASLQPSQELIVNGPFGDFIYPAKHGQRTDTLVLIAIGSGITPIFSIIKTALFTHNGPTIELIYAGKNIKNLMFYKQLEQLKLQFGQRLNIHYVLKDASPKANTTQSRLNTAYFHSFLSDLFTKNNGITAAYTDVYLCGSTAIENDLLPMCTANMISDTRVHIERFVQSYTEAKGTLHQIKIKLANNSHAISVASNQTVLEVALANKIDLPYGCNSGHCGSCKCKVEQGCSTPISDNIAGLTRAEKAAGYVLSCQCRPLENMTISIEL